MGTKQQWQEWQHFLCAEAERMSPWWFILENASYEEAQSRLRLSMLCKATLRPIGYSFAARIVELSHFLLEADEEFGRV